MESQTVVGVAGLCWLVCSFLVMARSVRRGRELAETLAKRHPATYEGLGRPRPGYLQSVRRTRFARFVGRREYENLDDESLSTQFEAYRRSESRLVVAILTSGVALALLAFAVRHTS